MTRAIDKMFSICTLAANTKTKYEGVKSTVKNLTTNTIMIAPARFQA